MVVLIEVNHKCDSYIQILIYILRICLKTKDFAISVSSLNCTLIVQVPFNQLYITPTFYWCL